MFELPAQPHVTVTGKTGRNNFHLATTSLPSKQCTYGTTSDGIVGADMDAKELRRRQKSNQAVARCIPVILICAVIYASWVFVGPLCGRSPTGRSAQNNS